MSNKFSWIRAKDIDKSLEGENWPQVLCMEQIANLHFTRDKDNRKVLLRSLHYAIESGHLEFDDIGVICSWNYNPYVSVGYAGYFSPSDETIREMFRQSRESELINAHQPACGWGALLKGIKPGESKRLEKHACGCEIECKVKKDYHSGLPKWWRIEGVHPDGLKIDFSCAAKPLITVSQFLNFCAMYGVPASDDLLISAWKKNCLSVSRGINESPVSATSERETANNLEEGCTSKQRKKTEKRQDNLTKAILDACKSFGKKPPFEELWKFFQEDRNETGFIADYTNTHLIWRDTKGKLKDTQKESVANRLSRLNYP
ncbi:MAG: hypothetical protein ACXW03_05315 [Methylobacter sp.]